MEGSPETNSGCHVVTRAGLPNFAAIPAGYLAISAAFSLL